MKSSNTSLDATHGWQWAFRSVAIVYAAACLANQAYASDSNQQTAEYNRRDWGAEQGFPGGPVHAISQTSDGYLWIGSEKGLIRFDGFNFRVFDQVNSEGISPRPVQALTADSAGDLWIQEQNMTLLRFDRGKLQNVLKDSIRGDASVTAMCRGKDGGILFLARSRGVLTYRTSGVETLLITSGVPNFLVISMAQTADGTIWLGTRDAGLFSIGQDQKLTAIQGIRDWKVNSLLAFGERELWIGGDAGLVRWNGTALVATAVPEILGHAQILAMLKDHESNVWISSTRGLVRIDPKGVAVWEERRSGFESTVNTLFEDREGDIWAGTNAGLSRFRESPFSTYSASDADEAESNGPLYADDEGRIWSGAPDGGLMWRRGGQIEQVTTAGLNKDVVLSIAGRKNELWIGRRRGGLTHLRSQGNSFTAETYTHLQGLAQDSVYAVHQSSDGTVWAGSLTGGVTRFRDGHFTTYTVADGLQSRAVGAIAESPDGTMWFGTPRGLSAFSSNRWRRYAGADGLPPGGVNCLFVDSQGILWIGTRRGLAFLRSGRVQNNSDPHGTLQEEILGIAEDRTGELWVSTTNHIARVNRQKLLLGPLTPRDLHEYGIADGLLGTSGVKRNRSVVSDSAGRIWISTNRGISVVDPARLNVDSLPVITHIQAISADGTPLTPGDTVQIPTGRKRLIIGYVGLNLSFPERVTFRYKLDGFDRDWAEATTLREAVYTNLEPRSYRFHVKASDAAGIWDSPEATVGIQVDPAFWQTWWFRLSGGLALLLVAALMYRFRLNQISNQLKFRFEERLAERSRIAQELHDTLLQGFISASMQLHVLADAQPEDSSAKHSLQRTVQLVGHVIEEGRNALRGLRVPDAEPEDLEKAFARVPQDVGVEQEPKFRISVEGQSRALRSLLRDEIYRIGREALVNAFRHARAKNVDMELEYGSKFFRLLVRDDGCGMDQSILKAGREGHWGLRGMRERSERIGGTLHVWSRAMTGTEVAFSVPNHVAFGRAIGEPWAGRIRRLLTRKTLIGDNTSR